MGAINILERGHRLLACGELGLLDHSVKQEPTEVTQELVAEHRRNPRPLGRGGIDNK